MTERNMACTNQILDMELDLGHSFHPEPHVLFGNTIGFSTPAAHPSQVTPGIPANIGFHQFLSHNGNNAVYGNQYNNLQYGHPVSNFEVGCFAPSNFSSNSYVASSSNRPINGFVNVGATEQLPTSRGQRVMGVAMDEHGLNSDIIDAFRGYNKQKNEGFPEEYWYSDGSANPDSSSINLSMNFGHQHRNEYEAGPSYSDATAFIAENRGSMHTLADGPPESVRSRTNNGDLHLESASVHHRNHHFQENYVPHSFQPAGSWSDQFGNNVNDGGVSNQVFTHSTPYLLGYPGATSSRNGAATHHPPGLYSHRLPILPAQGMRTHGHTHYQVPPLPFGRPVNDFQTGSMGVSRDGLHIGPRYTRLVHTSASEGTYRPPRRVQTSRDYSDGRMRFIHPEHVAFLDLSAFYEVGSHSDQLRDMRMDIDSMTYEELLALEEHIGDVSIGLSEESILKHLKTRIHVPQLASLSLKSPCSILENENCVICQVEFEENERIGTLDCGHDYHADCIKQWLLLKNLCPICKTTALTEEKRKDGRR